MPDKPNGSPTRELQPEPKIVAPKPASTVAGALKTQPELSRQGQVT